MFNSKDFDTVRLALQHKRTSTALNLKQAIADEGPSRHVADLARELRQVEEDDKYYLRLMTQPRSLFTTMPTRHIGGVDDTVEEDANTP
jgi:hypothetical protein